MWMTDFGWLVGPLQVTATLLAGATCVLVEGTPDYPTTDRIWRLVKDHKISFLGCGPTLARMMMQYGNKDSQNTICPRFASQLPQVNLGIRILGCGSLKTHCGAAVHS